MTAENTHPIDLAQAPAITPGRRIQRRKLLATGALVALVASAVAACSSGGDDAGASPSSSETTSETSSAPAEERTLTVLAAASLRDVFTDIASGFEDENDGVTVTLSFAGSSDLVDQILAGSPADVFASADTKNMDRAVEGDGASDPVTFATNTLTIVTPPGNPGGVTSLADLAKTDLKVVVCAPEVPCGNATNQVADAAGVTINRVSEEQSVTDVLAKVTAGEADAGIVYVTDATIAGDDVDVVDVPETKSVVNTYPIAVTTDAKQAELAQSFIDTVTGTEGQAALAEAGFGKP